MKPVCLIVDVDKDRNKDLNRFFERTNREIGSTLFHDYSIKMLEKYKENENLFSEVRVVFLHGANADREDEHIQDFLEMLSREAKRVVLYSKRTGLIPRLENSYYPYLSLMDHLEPYLTDILEIVRSKDDYGNRILEYIRTRQHPTENFLSNLLSPFTILHILSQGLLICTKYCSTKKLKEISTWEWFSECIGDKTNCDKFCLTAYNNPQVYCEDYDKVLVDLFCYYVSMYTRGGSENIEATFDDICNSEEDIIDIVNNLTNGEKKIKNIKELHTRYKDIYSYLLTIIETKNFNIDDLLYPNEIHISNEYVKKYLIKLFNINNINYKDIFLKLKKNDTEGKSSLRELINKYILKNEEKITKMSNMPIEDFDIFINILKAATEEYECITRDLINLLDGPTVNLGSTSNLYKIFEIIREDINHNLIKNKLITLIDSEDPVSVRTLFENPKVWYYIKLSLDTLFRICEETFALDCPKIFSEIKGHILELMSEIDRDIINIDDTTENAEKIYEKCTILHKKVAEIKDAFHEEGYEIRYRNIKLIYDNIEDYQNQITFILELLISKIKKSLAENDPINLINLAKDYWKDRSKITEIIINYYVYLYIKRHIDNDVIFNTRNILNNLDSIAEESMTLGKDVSARVFKAGQILNEKYKDYDELKTHFLTNVTDIV